MLNAGFYRPVLLARDLASVDSAIGGRLEIGLGAGYAQTDFVAAGLPFQTPAERIRLVQEHVLEIRKSLSDPCYTPPAVQTPPPIMIAGIGNKMLAMAAQHADIIAIGGFGTEQVLVDRIRYVKTQAGERLGDIGVAFTFVQVSLDNHDDLLALYQILPKAEAAHSRRAATSLNGSVDEKADRVRRYHDDLGISYFTFYKTAATCWETMRRLVDAIRWHNGGASPTY